jgi:hypothetical protein
MRLVFAAALVICLAGTGTAQNCCAPAVPQQGVLGETTALPHTLELGFHYEHLCSCGKYDGSDGVDDPDDTKTDWKRATLTVGYGIIPRLGVTAIVPYLWKEKSEIAGTSRGRIASTAEGIGDMSLLVRYSPLGRSFVNFRELSLGAGVKIPTGPTDRQKFGKTLLAELQPGTGSWDYIGAVSFYQGFEPVDFVVSATYLMTTAYDGYDFGSYEFGDQFSCLLIGTFHLSSRVDVSAALSGTRRGRDRMDGEVVSSTGRHQVWVMPGVQVQAIPERLRLHVYYEEPVYQHFNGVQLGSDYNLRFTASYLLPLAEAEE